MTEISPYLDTVAAAIRREAMKGSNYAHDYRRMAQAAIDSLQLTPEWTARGAPGVWLTKQGAVAHARYHGEQQIGQRFVSPWVRSDA